LPKVNNPNGSGRLHRGSIYGRQRKGAHEWMIEFKILLLMYHIQALDESIQSLNSDYEAKRYNNMTLNPLIINVARKIYFTIG
jgi:hypothetical protein